LFHIIFVPEAPQTDTPSSFPDARAQRLLI
jgi:hypothetical protein